MSIGLKPKGLYRIKIKGMDFENEWLDAFGKPELAGSWIIYGPSYNGKTTFCCQTAKYLTKFGLVAYNSLEEGISLSITNAFKRVKMEQVNSKILLLDKLPLHILRMRLEKRNPPRVVIIDSVQYSGLNKVNYRNLLADFPRTLFIWVSHEKNNHPQGSLAQSILYDAHVKIRVVGYKAFVKSRFNDKQGEMVIWKEGADKFHGFDF